MPVFTHALLLREGRVVASGSKRGVLTSERLSATFDAPLRLAQRDGRYRLSAADQKRRRVRKGRSQRSFASSG